MSRNIKTRDGFDFWDRLNAIPHYGFLLNERGNGVVRAEGVGYWIERNAAQVIVDDAQSEVNVLREENVKLRADVVRLSRDADRYEVLRQENIDTIDNGGLFAGLVPENLVINGNDLDRRTDAVIAQRLNPS